LTVLLCINQISHLCYALRQKMPSHVSHAPLYISCSSCPPNLDDLAGPLLVAPQCRPARSIELHERQFEFRSHYLVLRIGRVDLPKKRNLRCVPLVIPGWQVQINGRRRRKFDDGPFFVNFLQEKTCDYCCGGLVEIVPAVGLG